MSEWKEETNIKLIKKEKKTAADKQTDRLTFPVRYPILAMARARMEKL